MSGTWRAGALALAAVACAATGAQAGGFNIYEAGARATALGGAFTATADDGSAIFYNPAGIAFLEGTVIDANLMPVVPGTKFTAAEWPTPGETGRTTSQSFPIPGLYGARNTGRGLAYGLGVYAPFGLGVEWQEPEQWVGRQASWDVDLATIYVSPVVAYRFNDRYALSVGVDVGWSEISLSRFTAVEFGGGSTLVNAINADLEGSSKLNVTPCAGLMWRPDARLSFGAMYHHSKKLEFDDGEAILSNVAPAALSAAIDARIAGYGGPDQKLATELDLPWILALGASYRFSDVLRAEVNAVRFGWSEFEKLVLDFETDALDQTIEEQYVDVWQLRCGLDLTLSPAVNAMFGYCHDNSPQPYESISPLLPDADREDFSCGLQVRTGGWKFTGSYMAVMFHERSNVVDGEVRRFGDTLPVGSYDSIAHIIGLGIGHGF